MRLLPWKIIREVARLLGLSVSMRFCVRISPPGKLTCYVQSRKRSHTWWNLSSLAELYEVEKERRSVYFFVRLALGCADTPPVWRFTLSFSACKTTAGTYYSLR